MNAHDMHAAADEMAAWAVEHRATLDIRSWVAAGWSEEQARELVGIARTRLPDGTLPGVSVKRCEVAQ